MVSPDTLLGGRFGTGTAPAPAPTPTDVPSGVKLPLSIQPIGGGVGILVDADGVPVVGDDGMPILRSMDTTGGGAGSPGRTQFPSEQALDAAQAARLGEQSAIEREGLQIDRQRLQADIAATEQRLEEIRLEDELATARDKIRLQAEREMLEMRLENSRRELVFSAGMAERGTLIQQKAETGRELMRLGPDPFRQAAILSGGVQRGTTPQQVVAGQAQGFMNQPLPQISMDMTVPQLEAALLKTQNQGMTQPQFGGFGFAEGGVIEMENKDGAFSMSPKQSWLIGEGKHGEGLAAGTAEVLTVEKGPFGIKRVEVTPLAGQAQAGLDIGVQQALSPLFSGLGFSGLPSSKPFQPDWLQGPRDFFMPGFESGAAGFNALGIRPQLLHADGTVYFRQGDTLRPITLDAFIEGGFRMQDVINVPRETLTQFGTIGPRLTSAPSMTAGPTPAFQAAGSPFVSAVTGTPLPMPFKQANLLGQWQRERPDLFANALSAYGSALDPVTGLPTGGLSPETVTAQIRAATPTGRSFRPQRIGGIGARF